MTQNDDKISSQEDSANSKSFGNTETKEKHDEGQICDDVCKQPINSICKIRTHKSKYLAINCIANEDYDKNYQLFAFSERRKGHSKYRLNDQFFK